MNTKINPLLIGKKIGTLGGSLGASLRNSLENTIGREMHHKSTYLNFHINNHIEETQQKLSNIHPAIRLDNPFIILLVVITLIITVYYAYIAYIKIKYPFWCRQLLNFKYNMLNNFKNHKTIQEIQNLKIKGRFYDYNLVFYNFNNLNPDIKKKLIHNTSNIEHYFMTHDSPCYITYSKNHNGFIISRPLLCISKNKKTSYRAYVNNNYMNVPKELSKTDLWKLNYTHYVNCYKKTGIGINIFEKNRELENINQIAKPTISYDQHDFDLSIRMPNKAFQNTHYQLIYLNTQNSSLFYNFLNESLDSFDFKIFTCIKNLTALCTKGIFYVPMLMHDKVPKGFYIFKIENNRLTLMSSYKLDEITNDYFILGSIIAFNNITDTDKFSKNKISKLSIKNISDNDILIQRYLTKYRPLSVIKMDLFFINYINNDKYKNRKCMLIF